MSTNTCSTCGGTGDKAAKFCSHCGSPISLADDNSDPNKRSVAGRLLKWTGIGCGGIVALVILLAIVVIVADNGASTSDPPKRQATPKPQFTPTPSLSQMPFEQLKEIALRTISYDELFRNNETYVDKLVYYSGEVIQVAEGTGDRYVLRVNVTKTEYSWEDTVYLHYRGSRLLEEDIIEFVGRVEGLKTYKAIFGNSITIPEIVIVQSQLVSKRGG